MCGRIIKAALTTALLFIGLTAAAHAQETISPEKRALIKEMLAVTDMQKSIDMMTKAMSDQFEKEEPQRIADSVNEIEGLTPEEREKLRREMAEDSARFFKRYQEVFQQKVNLAEVLDQMMASILDKYFTEDDLKSLIAFYKSPVGVKMLQVMPQMMVDIMVKSNDVLKPKLEEVRKQVIEEERRRAQGGKGSPGREN